MQPGNTLTALVLLLVANGSPIVAAKLLGRRLSYPLDVNVRLRDGKRLLGASKTVRGVVVAVLANLDYRDQPQLQETNLTAAVRVYIVKFYRAKLQ